MKLLFDFLPILVFFLVYKSTGDIILATAVLIPASILQVSYTWWKHRQIEKMHIISLALIILLGGATVLMGDGDFIKWKPTIVNWLFAIAFFGSQQKITDYFVGTQINQIPVINLRGILQIKLKN